MVCAVKYIHAMDHAYCNLSCKSVMLGADSNRINIKVSGLHHMKHSPKGQQSLPKRSKSTEAFYSPPEVHSKILCDLKKCDVFSLGVILYMMLNLQSPFVSSELDELKKEQISRGCTMRRSNVNRLSLDCQVMIHTLLEPDLEMRWSIEMVHGMKWLSRFIDKHDGDN